MGTRARSRLHHVVNKSADSTSVIVLSGGERVPYPIATSPAATRIGLANRRSDTGPEVAVRALLHHHGLRFRKDLLIRAGAVRTHADIAFTRVRAAVFIDGCFWHACREHGTTPKSNTDYWGPKLQSNVDRDQRVNEALSDAGWRVLRIWEHEPIDEAVRQIVEVLVDLGHEPAQRFAGREFRGLNRSAR